jgi:hypothetical protein
MLILFNLSSSYYTKLDELTLIFIHKFYCWCGPTRLYHTLCLGSSICTLLYYCQSDKTGLYLSAHCRAKISRCRSTIDLLQKKIML